MREVFEAFKIAFVDEASRALGSGGEKQTLSRISIITGIDRPTVRRIFREQEFHAGETPVSSKVIGQWLSDPAFRARGGGPKPLTTGSDESQFAELVRKVTKNYSPGTMLQELLLLGVVSTDGERVTLQSEQVGYQNNHERALNLYARNADSLCRSFEENFERDNEDRNVNLRTEYDNIDRQKIPEIRRWLREEAARFHKRIREFLTKHDVDLSPRRGADGGGKVTVGSFTVTSSEKE